MLDVARFPFPHVGCRRRVSRRTTAILTQDTPNQCCHIFIFLHGHSRHTADTLHDSSHFRDGTDTTGFSFYRSLSVPGPSPIHSRSRVPHQLSSRPSIPFRQFLGTTDSAPFFHRQQTTGTLYFHKITACLCRGTVIQCLLIPINEPIPCYTYAKNRAINEDENVQKDAGQAGATLAGR